MRANDPPGLAPWATVCRPYRALGLLTPMTPRAHALGYCPSRPCGALGLLTPAASRDSDFPISSVAPTGLLTNETLEPQAAPPRTRANPGGFAFY